MYLFACLLVADYHKTSVHGGPIIIVRIGLCNTDALMEALTEKQVAEYMLLNREWAYVQCDKLTRETGKIVKIQTVQDFQNMSFATNKRFMRALGESSKMSEKMYPQLLGKSCMINAPAWIYKFWSIFKHIMSAKSVEKTKFCPARNTRKEVRSPTSIDGGVHQRSMCFPFCPPNTSSFNGAFATPSIFLSLVSFVSISWSRIFQNALM